MFDYTFANGLFPLATYRDQVPIVCRLGHGLRCRRACRTKDHYLLRLAEELIEEHTGS